MLPEEFVKRMKTDLGEDAFPDFLNSYDEAPNRSLRINPLKKAEKDPVSMLRELFSLSAVPWCGGGFYYDEESFPGKHPLHEAGAYYIQEASAMAPVLWLDVKPGQRVLDLCASPGGKSSEIASLMEDRGLLVSNEIIPERAKILSLNIERMGISNCLVTNESPDRLSGRFEGFFDRILVDAPCSGEGMFRRSPEACGEWSPSNVTMCGKRQDMILREAAKMLSSGGIMVYSTCTFSKYENEGSISRFLENNSDFYSIDPESLRPLPEGFLKSVFYPGGEGIEAYGVRLYPHIVKGEGHFFSVIRRRGSVPDEMKARPSSGGIKPAGKEKRKLLDIFLKENLPDITLPEGLVHEFGDNLYLAPPGMPELSGLKVLRPGLHLGMVKKERFEPSHALSLFLSPGESRLSADLSVEEAKCFIRGETLPSSLISGANKKGWCILSTGGFSLGWGKSDGRIIKNHYPKGLRKQL